MNIKFTRLAVFASLAVSACATNVNSGGVATEEMAEAIRIFEEVCMKTALSFSDAARVARRFGLAEVVVSVFTIYMLNKDHSLGVQIKENNGCVITTPSQRNEALTRQFLRMIRRYSATASLNSVPAKVEINGTSFVFHHDRKRGEAFVMLRAK